MIEEKFFNRLAMRAPEEMRELMRETLRLWALEESLDDGTLDVYEDQEVASS